MATPIQSDASPSLRDDAQMQDDSIPFQLCFLISCCQIGYPLASDAQHRRWGFPTPLNQHARGDCHRKYLEPNRTLGDSRRARAGAAGAGGPTLQLLARTLARSCSVRPPAHFRSPAHGILRAASWQLWPAGDE
jgi:hypothetical protein